MHVTSNGQGLTGAVTLDSAPLGNWSTHCLPLDNMTQIDALPWAPVPKGFVQVRKAEQKQQHLIN
jgi:hypothetical protein